MRIRLDIAYDGTDFSGWAVQPGQRTVQGELETALRTILRLPAVPLTVAGRTDAGVHASGQVAHCDVPDLPADLVRRLAGVLAPDLRVRDVNEVPAEFDARFGALWRRYVYRVCDAPGGVDPLRRRHVLGWPRRLDEVAMAEAASRLIGLHDFAGFCRRREGATTVRTLTGFSVERGATEVACRVEADAFCHSMVRSLVGALVAVGEGRRPVDWPASLLDRERRADDVPVAPALGLTLVEVGYPPDVELAARAETTRARRSAH
ncbi:MAG: tRNA pseudouridine38-40 synthase [Pseudonocardiales bacterium]|nr:tRNA pseudouridine38-40 synthase [Pseudonocardiales bacterium]MDT4921137.1 tRNA pseudouridine38-40 synthase [Pseudonocardiales bacterium]